MRAPLLPDGGSPISIVRGLGGPAFLVLDATAIYISLSNSIAKQPRCVAVDGGYGGPGIAFPLVTGASGPIAVDSQNLYFTDYVSGTIYQTPK